MSFGKQTLFLLAGLLTCPSAAEAQKWLTDRDSVYAYTAPQGQRRTLGIRRMNDSLYVMQHKEEQNILSEWQLPYPVYRFDCGDLTGDSLPEIAVGVIKPTRYFPVADKRLFLFRLYKETLIRPLWMGSRVARPLIDFRIDNTKRPARILTTEHLPDGTPVHASYRQEGFGLKYEGDVTDTLRTTP